ncbi:ECF transporter S component [Coprothermobacter platensis]|uniref:ECF transporter S component n=1 Tax=Coprothermobacter platensis TaxID=108819 RepID=UPI0003706F58|nr:ECF transporter S component [Coprothermobacter platensis]
MTVRFITRTAVLLALTVIFQAFHAPQLITGTLVNAMLLISAGFVGTWSGVIIGLFTPVLAFLFGIMKFPPMIPFIMIGNAVYVLVFSSLKNKPVSMVLGSVVKFLWLSATVYFMLPLFGVKVPALMVQMFTFPQLATAIMGGVLALIVLVFLRKNLVE